MKKLICILFSIVMAVSSLSVVANAEGFEKSQLKMNRSIDIEYAATIAMLFVIQTYEQMPEKIWNEETTITDVIPIYISQDEIASYCIMLETNGKPTGYVMVSAQTAMKQIAEYSCEGTPLFVDTCTTEEKIYHNGMLNFSNEPVDGITIGDMFLLSEENIKNSEALINTIKEIGTLSSDYWEKDSATLMAEPLTDPKEYMRALCPPNTVIYNSAFNNSLENQITQYLVPTSPDNTCVPSALAAIFKFNWIGGANGTWQKYYDAILSVASNNGYWGSSFGISWANYTTVTLKSIEYYEGSNTKWTASSHSLSAYTKARDEITNGRPVLFSIMGSGAYYNKHAVTAYAWTEFNCVNFYSMAFLKVQDGWKTTPRYVDAGLYTCQTTIVQPK